MRKWFLILIILFSFETVNALEKCTPSDEYLKYQELTEEEKENVIEPYYCKEIMNRDNEKSLLSKFSNLKKSLFSTVMDERYNAMDDGIITSIKNQYNLGTCWSFAAISSVESNALKNGLEAYDFSEAHMIYSLVSGGYSDEEGKIGKYITENLNGGKLNYGAAYFLNGYGQLYEAEFPYPTYQQLITKNEYKTGRKIISIKSVEFNNISNYSSCTSNEINTIKDQLLRNGAVQGSMYMDESLFKDSAKDYYLATINDSTLVNHAISIIGWDDTISKSKFKNATKDGAFIIKNSWGNDWSSDGLFYISYDDNFVCKNVVSYGGVSTETFDNYYKTADLVGLPEFLFDEKFYVSTKIKKETTNSEELKRVTFPTGYDMTYNIYLSKENDLVNKSNWIKLTSGSSNVIGFDSVNIDNITIEDDFTLIAEYTVTSGKTSSIMTMCTSREDTMNLPISTNTNFFSDNGIAWHDFASINVANNTLSCEPNFYAYTNNMGYTLEVSNLSNDNNIITINLNKTNINDNDNILYKIYDSNNNDITSQFIIEKDYTNNKVTVYSNNSLYGTYKIEINYKDIKIENDVELTETFTISNNSMIKMNKNTLLIKVNNQSQLTSELLMNNININNLEYIIKDNNNEVVENAEIGTNYSLLVNNITFKIVVIGDTTGDGVVNSADLLKIVKYLKGTVTLNDLQKEAADASRDKTINSADLLKIVKYLKGVTQFTF